MKEVLLNMYADIVLKNGEVITVDSNFSIKQAVAVWKDKIVEVGSNQDMEEWIGPDTFVLDLEGKSLLPGFIDAHLHMDEYALNKININVNGVRSIKNMIAELKKKAVVTPKGRWIRGWGYNDFIMEEKRMPTCWELDEISTEHPIYITRVCTHVVAANSYALQLAGIDEHTEAPNGGEIVRENGIPNGILKESARIVMLNMDEYSEQEFTKAIKMVQDEYLQSGITSVHDMGSKNKQHMIMLQKMAKNPDFKIRMYATVATFDNSSYAIDTMLNAGILNELGDKKFKIGPSKLFLDGTVGNYTAAMRDGYFQKEDEHGIAYLSQDAINQMMARAHLAGNQISAHAIGDAAIEMMINCIEYVKNLDHREDTRHRIEHATILKPDFIQRMRDLAIVVVVNPAFFYDFGDDYIEKLEEQSKHMFPVKSLLENGIKVAGGSDNPVTDFSPLFGIHGLVNRETKNGSIIAPNQKVSLEEAIKIFTINGAYASFEENIKGSIEKGKLADLVVLDQSILNWDLESIKDIKVDMTIIDGKAVFQKSPIK